MGLFLMIFASAFLSAFSQTVTGFGAAIILMALLPIVIPYQTSVMLALIYGSLTSGYMFWKYRKSLKLQLILLPVSFSALGAILGLFFGFKATSSLYLRLLGVLLFGLSLWFLFFARRTVIQATPGTGAAIGIVSGVLGAMFSISGPPLVLYYNAVTQRKDEYMAALQFCLTVISLIAISGRAFIGLWPQHIETYLIPCTLGAVCGALPGLWIHQKIDTLRFKQIVYLLMCISGIYFAVSA